MSEETPRSNPAPNEAPAAEIRTKRGFSIVWVIPLVALIIGGWLAYKALSERGPTITITFENAESLEAGKTKIKFKDVEVGEVKGIALSKDLSHVVVTAEMTKGTEPYLTDQTRFWVVRARVAAGEVSGLGTLFSGAYIGVDPKEEGKPQNHFKGLEVPPVLTGDLPGRHFTLRAKDLGSIDIGTPVYYRKVKVGKVVSYALDVKQDDLKIRVFIQAPYHEKVNKETRFYNASGIDVVLDSSGLRVNTESMVSVVLGGIAFENPVGMIASEQAPEEFAFQLYPDRESSKQKEYTEKRYYLLYFQDDVRGLSNGAPVSFRGIQVGKVLDFSLVFDWEKRDFQIPVLIEIEPERMAQIHGKLPKGRVLIDEFVARGLRAQLKTGNLITGQKFIDLAFHRDAPPAKVRRDEVYPVLPTIPQPLEQMIASVEEIVNRLKKIPTDEIGRDVKTAVESLDNVLRRTDAMVGHINEKVLPELAETLKKLQTSLAEIEKGYGADSSTNQDLRKALDELSEAARSIRVLTEYLQRHPESLIRGKGDKE
ncbi:MAG: MlaD family protein [Thermodesulfobacteriota bacterium]|nr:MlaD family protein [Thermodesulfobacteriota bacterium]